MSSEHFATVIIGGGQAGLAVGYYLAGQRTDFVILDAAHRVGQSWDSRWDSLRLFSPAHFTGLPGLRFPAPRRHLPTKDEMAEYLRTYAARFRLPVRLGWRVDRLRRDDDGRFLITSADRDMRADCVVVATGPAMRPHVPEVAAELDPAIRSLHAADCRNPAMLHDGVGADARHIARLNRDPGARREPCTSACRFGCRRVVIQVTAMIAWKDEP